MNEDVLVEKIQVALKPQFDRIDQRFEAIDQRFEAMDEKIERVFKEVLIVKEEVQEIRENMPSKDEITIQLDAHTKAINDLEEERIANIAWRQRVDQKLFSEGAA